MYITPSMHLNTAIKLLAQYTQTSGTQILVYPSAISKYDNLMQWTAELINPPPDYSGETFFDARYGWWALMRMAEKFKGIGFLE